MDYDALLRETWRAARAHPWILLLALPYGLLTLLPGSAVLISRHALIENFGFWGFAGTVSAGLLILGLAGASLATLTITVGQRFDLQPAAGPGEMIDHARRHLGQSLIASLVSVIPAGLIAGNLCALLLLGLTADALSIAGALGVILQCLSLILAVTTGPLWGWWLALARNLIVMEKIGAIAALDRSWGLLRSSRRPLITATLGLGIAAILPLAAFLCGLSSLVMMESPLVVAFALLGQLLFFACVAPLRSLLISRFYLALLRHHASPAVLIDGIHAWAQAQPNILALALAGSHARGAARPDSDIDLVLLCESPAFWLDSTEWLTQFGPVWHQQREDYGRLISLRVFYTSGLEVEFGFSDAGWAEDEGAQSVLRDGARILFERRPVISPFLPGSAGTAPQ